MLLLLLQVVNKNIFNADLTKLLGADAFSQAPRLAVQMIDLAEKGRVTALIPPPSLPHPPLKNCPRKNVHAVLLWVFSPPSVAQAGRCTWRAFFTVSACIDC